LFFFRSLPALDPPPPPLPPYCSDVRSKYLLPAPSVPTRVALGPWTRVAWLGRGRRAAWARRGRAQCRAPTPQVDHTRPPGAGPRALEPARARAAARRARAAPRCPARLHPLSPPNPTHARLPSMSDFQPPALTASVSDCLPYVSLRNLSPAPPPRGGGGGGGGRGARGARTRRGEWPWARPARTPAAATQCGGSPPPRSGGRPPAPPQPPSPAGRAARARRRPPLPRSSAASAARCARRARRATRLRCWACA
jgi:hypothetical protein